MWLLIFVPVFGAVAFLVYRTRRTTQAQVAFFDPAIDHAERALIKYAELAGGSFRPSQRTWQDLTHVWVFGLRLKDANEVGGGKSIPGSGGVELSWGGSSVRLSWVVVGLASGWALLPRVQVQLPFGYALSALHRVPTPSLHWPSPDYWDLWSRDVYDLRDRDPLLQLTPSEGRAFEALAPRSCRIQLIASSHPLRFQAPYALTLRVDGAPFHGESSLAPLDSGLCAWRDDFRPEDLQSLITLTMNLAFTMSPFPYVAPVRPAE